MKPLIRLFFVLTLGLVAALSGPQAAMADDTADAAGPVCTVAECVDTVLDTLEGSPPVCTPDTGKCCSFNPRDPKAACAAPPTCETDPSLCPPPGE